MSDRDGLARGTRAGSDLVSPEARWARLVDEHVALVWTWALRASGSRAAAAQVSEVAWLRLAQSLTSLTDDQVGEFLREAVHQLRPGCHDRRVAR